MPTNVKVNDLKINKLTEAQFDAAVQAGTIGDNEISVLTDAEFLPDQTGNSGKYLTTDGSDTSWSDKPLENNDEGYNSLGILDTDGGGNYNVVIGKNSTSSGYGMCNTVVGESASSSVNYGTAIGRNAKVTGRNAIQLGTGSNGAAVTNADADTFKVANKNGNFEIMSADGSIPSDRLKNAVRNYSSLPTASVSYENVIVEYTGTTDSNYTNGYFYKCSPDYSSASVTFTPQTGTTSTISIAPADFAKFVNQTLANMGQSSRVITHGYVARNWGEKYEVMMDTDTGWGTGQSKTQAELEAAGFTFSAPLELGEGFDYVCSNLTPTYAWTQTDVQPAPSGLPDQTGQSGKFLTTDGTDASWSDKPLVNNGTGNNSLIIKGDASNVRSAIIIGAYAKWGGVDGVTADSVGIGTSSDVRASGVVGIGTSAYCGKNYTISIGKNARSDAIGAIQFNASSNITTNSDANTFKVGNQNGNFEIMSADGTIPTDRFTTTPVADGTYVPTVSISSGVATRSWTTPASAPVVPATTPTLVVADWSSNTQTLTVQGVTASNVVLVSPAPASAADYASAGIVCTAQNTNSLTFTCVTVPSNAITLNVVIF